MIHSQTPHEAWVVLGNQFASSNPRVLTCLQARAHPLPHWIITLFRKATYHWPK